MAEPPPSGPQGDTGPDAKTEGGSKPSEAPDRNAPAKPPTHDKS